MEAKFKLINQDNGELLAEFPLEESEKAYHEASNYENMGLNIKLVSPGAAESLGISLGFNNQDIESLRSALIEEMESHEDKESCCLKKD